MSINVTIDEIKYSGVDQVDVGGKSLMLESDTTTPSGSVTITENGTHDVRNYASAVVNVAYSGGGDDIESSFRTMIEGGSGEIVIPDGVIKIRNSAFKNLTNGTVKMADSVEEICDDAFAYTDGCIVDKLPENLKTIGIRAFQYAQFSSDSTVLEIPQGVTTIGSLAFQSARGRSVLTFKGTPERIADDALYTLQVNTINVPWAEGAVAGAPWGKSNATINYNYTGA